MTVYGGGHMVTLEQRLWRHTVRRGACYVWTGACSQRRRKRGPAQYRPGPRPIMKVEGRVQYVYRVAYCLYIGEIPDGHDVHHTCWEPWSSRCWNPAHLQAVPAPVNRMVLVGRRRNGQWGSE